MTVAVAALAVNTLVARLLNPTAVGAYFLTFSVVTVTAAAARLGLPRVVVRFVSASLASGAPGEARDVIRRVTVLSAGMGVLAVAVLSGPPGKWLAASLFESEPMERVLPLAGLWAAMEALRYVLSEAFRGFHDFRLAALFGDAARGVLTAVVMAVLLVVWNDVSLAVVVGVSLAASTLTAAVAGVALQRRVATLGTATRVGQRLALIALPLMVVDLVGLLLNQLDLWVVGASHPAADVAVYGAAGRVAILLAVPLFVVNAVTAPLASELHVQGRHAELETALRGASTVASCATLVGFVIVLIAGGPILGLIFGSFARDGGEILAFLSAGQLVAVATGSCTVTLMMTGHQRTVMAGSVAALAVTVPGLIVAADAWGTTAVAAVSAAGLALQNIVLTVAARHHLGIWTHASLSPRTVGRFRRQLS